jgi:negative regulator of flagellin synthesis FlgM
MSVEINGLNSSALKNTGEGSPARVGRDDPSVPEQENGRPATSDTVSLTDAASRLKGLEKAVASLPVVDTHRVESLRKAVAEGSYAVDSQKVAEKLLDFERTLSEKT